MDIKLVKKYFHFYVRQDFAYVTYLRYSPNLYIRWAVDFYSSGLKLLYQHLESSSLPDYSDADYISYFENKEGINSEIVQYLNDFKILLYYRILTTQKHDFSSGLFEQVVSYSDLTISRGILKESLIAFSANLPEFHKNILLKYIIELRVPVRQLFKDTIQKTEIVEVKNIVTPIVKAKVPSIINNLDDCVKLLKIAKHFSYKLRLRSFYRIYQFWGHAWHFYYETFNLLYKHLEQTDSVLDLSNLENLKYFKNHSKYSKDFKKYIDDSILIYTFNEAHHLRLHRRNMERTQKVVYYLSDQIQVVTLKNILEFENKMESFLVLCEKIMDT